MRVWLLHVGEELPVDDAPRKFRYGYLADALTGREHQVLRWAPTFQHARKQQRANCDTLVPISPRYAIQLVYSPGYRRNVSVARWVSYRQAAGRFEKLAEACERPDVIVCGIPSLEWCEAGIRFGRKYGIPTVLDVRDLWPDVMLNAFPKALRRPGRVLLNPMYRRASRICRQADTICGVSRTYLEWALRKANRPAGDFDRVIPIGYESLKLNAAQYDERLAWLKSRGVNPEKIICCYIGQFENSYDVSTVLSAAKRLQSTTGCADLQIVLCGGGEKLADLKKQAVGLSNLVFLGWIDQPTIAALLKIAQIGLAAYAPRALQSLPNKVFEYLSQGLAVISSLPGELQRLLETERCGLTYAAGDVDALAQSIAKVVREPHELRAMGRRSELLFDRSFRIQSLYGQFSRLLEEVANESCIRHSPGVTGLRFAGENFPSANDSAEMSVVY